ncbi:MAG: CRTAC1 family protein, partial [Gammaproteobacteria bacterium]|nr:CRTAC1 family protein [Gammaproteobacteria bacterium]
AACGGGGSDSGGATAPARAPAVPPPPPPPPVSTKAFVDATAASGIDYQTGYRITPPRYHPSHFSTSGAAAADYDNDGDIDIFIVRGDIGPNLLYRNSGSGVFFDVAGPAGLAYTATANENYRLTGPAFADMDGDGDLDLFIGGVFGDPSFIYANNGDGTFTDVTAGSGIDLMQADYNISTSFGDYDLDGDLDMFISHWGTARDMSNPGDTEHLWRNDSAGGVIRFTSVSEAAGIAPSILTLPDPRVGLREHDYTFTSSFVRIDDDLYPDIVSVADYDQTMVFMNNRDGTFTNATDVNVITDSFGMGSALGDFDDDGDIDWFVTSIFENGPVPSTPHDGNRLYRNDGGVFVDVTATAGVIDGGFGWGACFVDLDNDGDLDIYHTNGWPIDFADDTSRAFVSHGAGWFSQDAAELGLDDSDEGRGVICADFDDDGDADILQLHRSLPISATLWRNNVPANNYLKIKLRGNAPNTEAAGARIFVQLGSRTLMREIIIGNNFLSQNPTVQLFGLGAFTQADQVRIEWPDGRETVLAGVAAGQLLSVTQPP